MGRSTENDEVLSAVINAITSAVCLVGKTHDFHVEKALGITLNENLDAIEKSMVIWRKRTRGPFDAEHFFDGYESNPKYATECALRAYQSGARWVVLCDTNGGTLPHEVEEIVTELIAAGLTGSHIGIHP